MKGLSWLARVGRAPLDAWRCAMGWSEVAARNHARRLGRWLERYPMTRGHGSLFVATRTGVAVLGLSVRGGGAAGADLVGTSLRLRLGGGVADRGRAGLTGRPRVARRPGVVGRDPLA
jgi:hypothetical protein